MYYCINKLVHWYNLNPLQRIRALSYESKVQNYRIGGRGKQQILLLTNIGKRLQLYY